MFSVAEAQNRINAGLQPVDMETVPVDRSAGRVLAEEIHAPEDLPGFDNSSMDGFAVQAADVQEASPDAPVILRLIADIPAGSALQVQIGPGQAARIMTGAPVPPGADAVIPVEDTNFAPPGPTPGLDEVQIHEPARPGAYIRPRGQDVRQGQSLLPRGRLLQPQDVGILASIGKAQVSVYRRPRVALFSSGDELVPPGQPLGPGQIFDSNQYMLAALLEREGADVIRLGTAPDRPEAIQALLQEGVTRGADLIVTSAGVSVGAFDYVRQVIEAHGSLHFWKVNMRPGKPLAFGAFYGVPLIGLPGNPVSSYVGCRVFVLPALYRLAGRSAAQPHHQSALLAEPIESDGRESYLRGVVHSENGVWNARLTGHQGSGNLYSIVQANALLIVPSGVKSLPQGSQVEFWFLEGE